MDHNDNELEQRLRAIGTHPIDPETRHIHYRRIEAASPSAVRHGRRRYTVLAVAAAGVIGFLAGSTGLAMAGSLPDPAQDVAHDVFGVLQVDVPEGSNRGSCVSQAAKIEDKAAKQAAIDACPKGPDHDEGGGGATDAPGRSGESPGHAGENPGHSGDAPGRTGDVPVGNGAGAGKHDGDPCRGRPVWAGPMPPEQRTAVHEANSRDNCVEDDDAADAEVDTAPSGSTVVEPTADDDTAVTDTSTTTEVTTPVDTSLTDGG